MALDGIPEIALSWHRAGRGAVLATVIETWGSAPRRVGSQLVVSGTGEIEGSVSGGCVEGAVVAEALEALSEAQARLLSYGVSDDDAFQVGLACGGTIRILVEPVGKALPEDLLSDLVSARAARKPVAYVVRPGQVGWLAAVSDYCERFRQDRSGLEGETFIAIHNPPLRMVIVGAVHIAQPLVTMAHLAGYDPVLVDPREAFGSPERFANQTLIHDWPDEALAALKLDARTAVVTLTHDPKLDDPAIQEALGSDVFYLGCLGSKRTHEKRVMRLQEAGFSKEQIARIHAPVGLDIGAASPAEIAVSIMAEITQRLRRP